MEDLMPFCIGMSAKEAEDLRKAFKAHDHMIEALRCLAVQPCNKKNCGTVCLCGSCHARAALEFFDPEWRP